MDKVQVIRPHRLAPSKQLRKHRRVFAILNAYSVPWLVSFVVGIVEPIENFSAVRIS